MHEPKFPEAPDALSRRTVVTWITFGWVAFTAAFGFFSTALFRYFFPNVLFEPPQKFKVGFPSEYQVNKVSEQWKAKYGVWVIRNEDDIYSLIAVCTHLGCTPNWLEAEQKFKCPCHGSGYYMSGINFEGPAPRPLERAWIGNADDGQLLVDKSIRFRYEKGEWEKPHSLLETALN